MYNRDGAMRFHFFVHLDVEYNFMTDLIILLLNKYFP